LTTETGDPDLSLEASLGDIEGRAIEVVREAIASRTPPGPGTTERETLASFMAVQYARTPFRRAIAEFAGKVHEFLDGRELNREEIRTYLQRRHLFRTPEESEVEAAFIFTESQIGNSESLSSNEIVSLPFSSVEPATDSLLRRAWSLEYARKPRLITCDSPVIIWSPSSPGARMSGIGLDNAKEVRFPLDLATQLVLKLEPYESITRIEPARVRECNSYAASYCHNEIIGHPDFPTALDNAPLSRRRLTVRFNMISNASESGDEILHIWYERNS
jgi:hypothetical protein